MKISLVIILLVGLVTKVTVTADLDSNRYTNLKSVGKINPFLWQMLANVQRLWLNVSTRRKATIVSKSSLQTPFSKTYKFPCNITLGRSNTRPISVHKLRPGDINVIGAIGDSMSTATGALSTKLGHLFTENRGLAWNIGGQWTWRNSTTLPNILKEFNPKLVGYSLNDSFTYSPGTEFNLAEIGAVTTDLLGMAMALVERIKKDSRVNFDNDWKLVTIAIGANDICSYVCGMKNPNALPEIHRKHLTDTLRYLRDHLPRTFVNVVSKPRIRILLDFTKKNTYCDLMQLGMCSCFTGLFFNATNETRAWFEEIEEKFIRVEEQVARLKEFRGLTNFTVVYQTWTSNLTLKVNSYEEDRTLLAYDCFHISQKGEAYAGVSIWNNMLERDEQKTKNWAPPQKRFLCPTLKNPYFYTYDNDK